MSLRLHRILGGLLALALALTGLLALPAPSHAATQVCALACDTLDPSRARQETFPVADRTVNGRVLRLHVSEADDMAWASIDNGTPGDAVWLDRPGTAGWWAIAWVAAYDHTHEQRYLDEAVTITNYVQQYWDTGTCGGGVWWNRERTYKNAVTNGLYLWLTTALHRRIAGDTVWGGRATTAARWYLNSGLINSAGLVNDGQTSSCANNGQTVWSYNQGLAIGAFTELWRSTGDGQYLSTAQRLADAALSSAALTRDGVLTESCDTGTNTCDDNQKQFKGVFVRHLSDLADATGSAAYRTYLTKQADSVWAADRDPLNRLGERWAGAGTGTNVQDWRTQASALEALTAAG